MFSNSWSNSYIHFLLINVVPFYLWFRLLFSRIIWKYYIFLFVSLKKHWNSKMISFLVEKKWNLNKCWWPVAIATVFSPDFVLHAKLQNTAFWNISYLGPCHNWVGLNINFKSEEILRSTKVSRKCKIKLSLPS